MAAEDDGKLLNGLITKIPLPEKHGILCKCGREASCHDTSADPAVGAAGAAAGASSTLAGKTQLL
jgi:hypothetical protein